ncbi:MAG: glycosyltransferase [Chloroflexi bacterium]|nr:glycosyltransferase [Chloroflexota bacterium]
MKITVVIPTYNAAATLAQALDSVIEQDHPDVEIVIVDGESTDDTWAIVQQYRSHIANIIREPDAGVFDALNKGILASEGDVIVLLGADDYFLPPHVLSAVATAFAEHPEVKVVYGDYLRDKGDERVLFQHPDRLDKFTFLLRNPLCQHAVFVRREAFDRVGLFDSSFKIVSDHDWNLRAFGQYRLSYLHIPVVICGFRSGGLSSTSASKCEHALVRRRYFSWPYRFYWSVWDISRRVAGRLRQLDFRVPLALRKRLSGIR